MLTASAFELGSRSNGRTLMSRVIATVVLMTLMLSRTFAQDRHQLHGKNASAIKQQIRDIEDEDRDAMLKGDSSFMESHSTANVYRVAPDGTVANRDQLLKVWRKEKFSAVDVQTQEISIYGNTALVLERVSIRGRGGDGRQIDGEYRLTRLWLDENGVWKVAALHLTRITAAGTSGKTSKDR
jgi:ketosteroid isomerase-like protein